MMAKGYVLQQISKCKQSRKAKKAWRCKSDWCGHCSKARTDWLVEQQQRFFSDSPTLYLVTILQPPTFSYKQGEEAWKQALDILATSKVRCIGGYEYGNEKDTKAWQSFMASGVFDVMKFNRTKFGGLPHGHFICDERLSILAQLLFPLRDQCRIQQLGITHKYKDQSKEDQIRYVTEYYRKKKGLYEQSWFQYATGEQLIFKCEDGIWYKESGRNWVIEGDRFLHESGGKVEGESGERINKNGRLLGGDGGEDGGVVYTYDIQNPSHTIPERTHDTRSLNVVPDRMSKAREIIERLKEERRQLKAKEDSDNLILLSDASRRAEQHVNPKKQIANPDYYDIWN